MNRRDVPVVTRDDEGFCVIKCRGTLPSSGARGSGIDGWASRQMTSAASRLALWLTPVLMTFRVCTDAHDQPLLHIPNTAPCQERVPAAEGGQQWDP
jgi:hypothetical protein